MVLMRCPECGKIIISEADVCARCGSPLGDENASPEIMTGLISAIMGILIFLLYLEFYSAPFLWTAAAFFLITWFSAVRNKNINK